MSNALSSNNSKTTVVENLEARLSEARAELDTAWNEYGAASAEAIASGNDPSKTKAAAAMERAQRRAAETEAALDFARRALSEQRAAQEAEEAEAKRQQSRRDLEALTAAAQVVDQATGELGRAVDVAMEAYKAAHASASPEIRTLLTDALPRYRHCLAWHTRAIPGFKLLDFMTDARARWVQYIPDASQV